MIFTYYHFYLSVRQDGVSIINSVIKSMALQSLVWKYKRYGKFLDPVNLRLMQMNRNLIERLWKYVKKPYIPSIILILRNSKELYLIVSVSHKPLIKKI